MIKHGCDIQIPHRTAYDAGSARFTGRSNTYAITQYESGVRKPNILMLKKLARALNTTADALLEPINIEEETENE